MGTDQGPGPLLESDLPVPNLLREALEGAREDMPSPGHFEQMLARFPVGPSNSGDAGASGSAPAAGAATSIVGAKTVATVAIATVISGAVALIATPYPPAEQATALHQAASLFLALQLPAAPNAESAAPPVLEPTPAASAIRRSHVAPLSSGDVADNDHPGPPSEMDLLRQAHSALAASPSRAMQLVSDHARYYPSSPLAQEREMIRIQALVAMGRTDQARAAASAFRKQNQGSAYLRRLDQLLPE